MSREEAIKTIGKDLACYKASDDCGLNCGECNLLTDSKDLIESYKIAIKALKVIDSIEKALPKICTTEFEAYVYHKILTIEEGDDGYE